MPLFRPRIVRALTVARNLGYWRDRGSLMWSFIVPPFLIICLALAFSRDDPSVFRVGWLTTPAVAEAAADLPFGTKDLPPAVAEARAALPPILLKRYIDLVAYGDDTDALRRVRHHQLDMLVKPGSPATYWVNPLSSRGEAVEALLVGAEGEGRVRRELVEGRKVRYIDWVVPGILGMNLMFSGLFGVGYVIVRYRKNGVLKRLKATPVSPLEFLLSQLVSRFLIMVVVSFSVFSAANLVLDLMMLGSYLNLALVAIIGNLALISVALVVSARITNEELANGILNLIALPMLLLSEVWFSLDGVPEWMQGISRALPLTHMVGAARAIMVEGANLADIAHHLALLAAMAVVCIALAAKLFRWD